MSDLPQLLTQARATGDWAALVDAVPFSRWLGLQVRLDGGELITTMPYVERLVGNYTLPALHGGALAGLLESAAIFSLLHVATEVQLPRVINVTVDYLRSARARDTYAAAGITKLGRRVALVRAAAWQDDRAQPIALADAHFLIDSL